MPKMRIGVDFDNTIVCFDPLFRSAALNEKLIPRKHLSSKTGVRNYLQKKGRNDEWTRLQGIVYGDLIRKAKPFPGVKEFFSRMRAQGHQLFIVSHKTKRGAAVPHYDLHTPAKKWIKAHGIKPDGVFFEPSMAQKLRRIRKLKCDVVIDDLYEFLSRKDFPSDIQRVLFDPNRHHPRSSFDSAASWNEVGRRLPSFRLVPLSGGGNNRGFRVETGKKNYFLKLYAHHPTDKRDRLRNEFGFCRFIWDQGLHWVPRPIAKDEEGHLGIYEYIEGRLLTPRDVTPARVKEAVRFYLDVNKCRKVSSAQRLPAASEACFSIEDHFEMVTTRVNRMNTIKNRGPAHRQAIQFVKNELAPSWKQIKQRAIYQSKVLGLSLCQVLRHKQRCLSPSDFGFHNAILTKEGRLRFIDFEYAGWDDPAKTICDFALQPRLPFPRKMLPLFSAPVLKYFGDGKFFSDRARVLYPVFALKWCCIILNGFLREGQRQNLSQQIVKAKKYLKLAREGYGVR